MGMGGGKGDLNAEINVTPMVDVMLVLLVIFMVTAPMMKTTGVPIELPSAEADIFENADGPLILKIDPNGEVWLGETKVPWEELEVKLSTSTKVQGDSELYIEGHKSLRYELVLQAMATARKAHVKKVLLVTEPLDQVGGE